MPPKRPSSNRGSMPQHRVYEPGKRYMELIASVSRSSGLEKDGDAYVSSCIYRGDGSLLTLPSCVD